MEHRITRLIIWKNFGIIVVLIFLMSACYYDNEECLYPEGSIPCDTTEVTYSENVWPVINTNCTGCHSEASPQGNVKLENYEQISAAGNIAAGQYGSLYGTISHLSGNSPMPKNESMLSDCTIDQIRKWIDNGTPNN